MHILFNYTKLNAVILAVTIILFALLNYSFENISNAYSNMKNDATLDSGTDISAENNLVPKSNKEIVDTKSEAENLGETKKEVKEKENKSESKNVWQLEIPKIKLTATISSGTTEDVMNKYIGHFEDTSKWNGNVGLAAHNRRLSSKLL